MIIPAKEWVPLAWPFQNAIIAEAFPNPDDGTIIYYWDWSRQIWIINTYDALLGEWDDPQMLLENGHGFYYKNPTDLEKTIIISGQDIEANSVNFTFDGGKMYLCGYAFLVEDSTYAVECVYWAASATNSPPNCISPSGHGYMDTSLNYHSSLGDVFWTWNEISVDPRWIISERAEECCSLQTGFPAEPFWKRYGQPCSAGWSPANGLSPQVLPGRGFWLRPAVAKQWVHVKYPISCTNRMASVSSARAR